VFETSLKIQQHVSHQRLIYEDQQQEDSTKLSSSNIKKDSIITMVLCLQGGAGGHGGGGGGVWKSLIFKINLLLGCNKIQAQSSSSTSSNHAKPLHSREF
jgi:hypothetical protein